MGYIAMEFWWDGMDGIDYGWIGMGGHVAKCHQYLFPPSRNQGNGAVVAPSWSSERKGKRKRMGKGSGAHGLGMGKGWEGSGAQDWKKDGIGTELGLGLSDLGAY